MLKNYFSACCARLGVNDSLYKQMSGTLWAPIIRAKDSQLFRYLNGEQPLPSRYAGVDFFADDEGLKRIFAKASPLPTDNQLSAFSSVEQACCPFECYGVFAETAVEKPMNVFIEWQKLPVLLEDFTQQLVDTHRMRAVGGIQKKIEINLEDVEMEEEEKKNPYEVFIPYLQPQAAGE